MLEQLDPDPVDVAVMRGYPGPWLAPVTIALPDGSHRLVCRLCLARAGIGGETVQFWRTSGEVDAHIRGMHHLEGP